MYKKSLKRSYSKFSNKNSIMGDTSSIPVFSSARSEDGSLTVSHKEYICDIQGSTALSPFTLQNYLVNPGNPMLFPWLAQIAQNYDEYKFHGLIFHFRSTSTDNSTANSQLGTIIIAANYNSSAPNFLNKQQMMEYAGATSVKISEDLQFGIECNPNKSANNPIEYVAPNGVAPVGEDAKSYMIANLQIAVNATQQSGQIGELWCSYKVTLRKPKYCVTNALCQPFFQAYNVGQFPTLTATQNTSNNTYLNLTPRTSIATFPAVAGDFGYVTNITNPNTLSGPFNFSNANGQGVGFRFPDTLGSGTYFVQFILRGMIVTEGADINFKATNVVLLKSSNITSYSEVKGIDNITQDSPVELIYNVKLVITASAYSLGLSTANVPTGNFVTTANGTYFIINNQNAFASGSIAFTATSSASLTIQQINPSVTV